MITYYCDANIFIRIFSGDNPRYKRQAELFINKAITEKWRLLITTETFWELEYALRKFYQVNRLHIHQYLASLASDPTYNLEQEEIIQTALNLYKENNLDFIDNILLAKHQLTNIPLATFDKNLANTSPDNLLLQNQL